jgi:anti-sigma regulatory factor (Ser/Thr protein kinase)
MPYHRCPACGLTSYSAAGHSTVSSCPVCAQALTDDSKVVLVPGAKHNLSCSLRARPKAAAEARRAVVGLALPPATRETLELLVSELVTNSILHAGLAVDDTLHLRVDNGGAQVRVAVHDSGIGFTPPAPNASPPGVGGQGLVIAAALSDTWGVDCDEDGCTVWCNVALESEPDTAAEGDVTTGYVSGLAVEMARASATYAAAPQPSASTR